MTDNATNNETAAAAAPAPAVTETAVQTQVTVDGAELEALKAKAAKADENWDRFLRTAADLENFKKRAARERQEAVRYANESLLRAMLPVLDHFEMALAAAGPGAPEDAFRTGVTMICSQFRTALTDAGLEEIDAASKPFDPNWHEAVAQLDSTEVPEGNVLQQMRKGYKYRDRLLRPATVVVARKPTAAPAEGEATTA
jgi:molecular chaperone GrpE